MRSTEIANEVARKIKDRFQSIRELDAGIENGKIYARTREPKLLFDISNKKPKNADGILDWAILTKEEMIEVINILAGNADVDKVKSIVVEIINQQNIDESKEMYLIPFFE